MLGRWLPVCLLSGLGLLLWMPHPEAARRLDESFERGALIEGRKAVSMLPPVPSLLPSCQGEWLPIALPAHLLLLIFGALIFLLFLRLCVSVPLIFHFLLDRLPDFWEAILVRILLGGCLLCTLSVALWGSQLASNMTIMVPKDWHHCSWHSLERPVYILPWHAGIWLGPKEKRPRQEYYVTSMLWLILCTYLLAKLLSLLAREVRRLCTSQKGSYEPLLEPTSTCFGVVWQLGLNIFCASLALLAAATGRLDVNAGCCWEIYELWLAVMLAASLIQAIVFIASTPLECDVPDLGLPTIKAVVPVLGEPLDLFKDWIFVGLAVSSYTWLGNILAVIGILVLFISGAYMQVHHPLDVLTLRQRLLHIFYHSFHLI